MIGTVIAGFVAATALCGYEVALVERAKKFTVMGGNVC